MTQQKIEVPRLGESISEATVGEILVPSGTHVKVEQELMELETEKVNQILYAPVSGVVQWSVKSGDTVAVGSSMGFIEVGEPPSAKEPSPAKSVGEPPTKGEKLASKKSPISEQVEQAPAEGTGIRKSKEEGLRALREKTPEDIAKVQTRVAPPIEPPQPQAVLQPAPTPGLTRTRLSRMRKAIAAKMVESQRTTATLTTFNEVDMSNVMLLRARYKEDFLKKYGVKLGLLSFFVKATISALRAFPNVHAFIEGEDLIQHHRYDINIAVGTDRGVIVPVVRGCDQLSFAQIEKTLEGLATRAREGTITVEDLSGGSFTITNGGVYGSLLSTPILNAPQSGILGMHKIEERPVAVNQQVVIRPMMYLALSYDHRVVDGKEAIGFLVHVKNCLEDPARLLLQI